MALYTDTTRVIGKVVYDYVNCSKYEFPKNKLVKRHL